MLYARLPWIFGPFFVAETPWRLRQEMAAAFPSLRARLTFALAQLRTLARAPISMTRMAERARMISPLDLTADCARFGVACHSRNTSRVTSTPAGSCSAMQASATFGWR